MISGRGGAADLDPASDCIETFDGVELDEEARNAIAGVLRECAARRREVAGIADDESEPFVAALPPPQPVSGLWKPGDPVERDLPVYDVAASPEEMVEIAPTEGIEPEQQFPRARRKCRERCSTTRRGCARSRRRWSRSGTGTERKSPNACCVTLWKIGAIFRIDGDEGQKKGR